MHWWQDAADASPPSPQYQAVAYYRHSAQDRQENSVTIQQEQVRRWASENSVTIIHEFIDRGRSGLTAEGREAFNEMMEDWVKQRDDFQLVLCLDVSRWGRFQDIDLSATYSAECKRHGKQVVYTTLGKPKDDDQLHQVHVHFERYRAAQYSKELSDKVFRGCIKIAQQGYWAGGKPPYGLQRELLDEARNPLQLLMPGQRKGIQNQRVKLALGDDGEVANIRRIFSEFVDGHRNTRQIAEALNSDGVVSPGGRRWDANKVRRILSNELYIGTLVYNRTSQKLKTPSRHNPQEKWVKVEEAFAALVPRTTFENARAQLIALSAHYTHDYMIDQLRRLYDENGGVWASLIDADRAMPSAATYAKRFTSLDAAYQQVFDTSLEQVRTEVEGLLRGLVNQVESYDDFLIVNRKFTVLIQPSVPVPHGYNQYWYFRPDQRCNVDITLGVPLSSHEGPQILGYLALPRLLVKNHSIRLFGSSDSYLDMYGHAGLEIIFQLART